VNQGTMFLAPLSGAIAIKGFAAGLDPPAAGRTWHVRQEFELKRQLPTQIRSLGTRSVCFAACKLLILKVGATGLEPVTSCV
jgi:hypothetical protein